MSGFDSLVGALSSYAMSQVERIIRERVNPGPVAIGVRVISEYENDLAVEVGQGTAPRLSRISVEVIQIDDPARMRGRSFDCVFVAEEADIQAVTAAMVGLVVKPATGEKIGAGV